MDRVGQAAAHPSMPCHRWCQTARSDKGGGPISGLARPLRNVDQVFLSVLNSSEEQKKTTSDLWPSSKAFDRGCACPHVPSRLTGDIVVHVCWPTVCLISRQAVAPSLQPGPVQPVGICERHVRVTAWTTRTGTSSLSANLQDPSPLLSHKLQPRATLKGMGSQRQWGDGGSWSEKTRFHPNSFWKTDCEATDATFSCDAEVRLSQLEIVTVSSLHKETWRKRCPCAELRAARAAQRDDCRLGNHRVRNRALHFNAAPDVNP